MLKTLLLAITILLPIILTSAFQPVPLLLRSTNTNVQLNRFTTFAQPSNDETRISSPPSLTKSEIDLLSQSDLNEDISETSEPERVEPSTKTVNKRLMAEIENELTRLDGPKTNMGKKLANTFGGGLYNTYETQEQRDIALAEAKDLNGVNPGVCFVGSLFSFGCALACWVLVNYITDIFSARPIDLDAVYAVQRLSGLFRTIVIGIFALLSGFCGVNGLGLFLLSVRVGYGVLIGELDPTPVVTKTMMNKYEVDEKGAVNLPNVWNLMLGKQEGKKRR